MDNTELRETLKEHGERIKELEEKGIRAEAKIESLCDKLDSLINSLSKWSNLITRAILGAAGTVVISLIIFLIKKHI